ncbi:MAG TPA: dTDP-4-dehydrorhamnose 3,5-epimerase family protein [Candidatus Saccharimonadales bacterium]|nr:dTDP-4-dehydrorhamnose 3,5-epimerase family protein [Candidatus Saccharimonadales bacterium]
MAVPTTEVSAQPTDIPGLLIFTVTAVEDERGFYQETYQKAKLVAAGMPANFDVVQVNTSYNKQAGVTRGFHAEPWDKYITVLKGKVFAAYVDLREGESFGRTVTVVITPTTCVYLPQGVGNSFQTLEDDTYYLYGVNAHWSAELYDEYCFANLADPEIGISWPIPLDRAVMSERDRNHPMLQDAKRFKHG